MEPLLPHSTPFIPYKCGAFALRIISGDFAVLLEGGLSVRRALMMNLFSALTAFGGLFVGLAAINIENAVEWLLALTAGMFLYVAWLDMVSTPIN